MYTTLYRGLSVTFSVILSHFLGVHPFGTDSRPFIRVTTCFARVTESPLLSHMST